MRYDMFLVKFLDANCIFRGEHAGRLISGVAVHVREYRMTLDIFATAIGIVGVGAFETSASR